MAQQLPDEISKTSVRFPCNSISPVRPNNNIIGSSITGRNDCGSINRFVNGSAMLSANRIAEIQSSLFGRSSVIRTNMSRRAPTVATSAKRRAWAPTLTAGLLTRLLFGILAARSSTVHDAALVVFRCLDKAALVVSLLFVDVAYAEEVNLRCPWSSGGAAYADLVVVDLTARTLQRTVVDAGGNAIQTLPALKAEISDSEITATYNDTVYKLNRYTAALSSQFPSGAHTVLQCETYEKGAKKF